MRSGEDDGFGDDVRDAMRWATADVEAPDGLAAEAGAGGRRRLRRRRALQAAPVAAALAGLAALSPQLAAHRDRSTVVPAAPAPTPRTSAPSVPALAPAAEDVPGDAVPGGRAWSAFFDAGYDYEDAVRLGALWNVDTDQAKATAGSRLLAGEELPFTP